MIPFPQTIEVVNPQLEGGNVIQDYPVKVAKVPNSAIFPSHFYYSVFVQQYTPPVYLCVKCFTLAHDGCNSMHMRQLAPQFVSLCVKGVYAYTATDYIQRICWYCTL